MSLSTMSRNQSWQQENGCLVPPTTWAGVAFSMQHIHDAMTHSYHAKRQRANSVPLSSRPSAAPATEDHLDTVRAQSASTANTPSDTEDSDDNHPHSIIQAPEQAHNAHIPHWQRELAKSRVGRHSRASSIISTRTRLTVQSDDARSVDIEAGGQSYHINRDGSMVTNVTAPPPYPGPPLQGLPEESEDEDSLTRLSSDTVREEPTTPETSISRSLQSLPIRTHLPPTTNDDGTTTTPALTRKTSAFELPRPFRQVLNLSWYRSPTPTETAITPIPIKSAKSLRRTKSDSSSLANFRPFEPATFTSDINETHNSDDTSSSEADDPSYPKQEQTTRKLTHPSSPTLDPTDAHTAEVSAHYTRLIRTIDRTHRTRLTELTQELSRLRELLNEKDIVYRQQLRDRDHVISELNERVRRGETVVEEGRRRMREVEEGVERRIEKATNEVEDMWEGRWKEYETCLRERLGGGVGGGGGAGSSGGRLAFEGQRNNISTPITESEIEPVVPGSFTTREISHDPS